MLSTSNRVNLLHRHTSHKETKMQTDLPYIVYKKPKFTQKLLETNSSQKNKSKNSNFYHLMEYIRKNGSSIQRQQSLDRENQDPLNNFLSSKTFDEYTKQNLTQHISQHQKLWMSKIHRTRQLQNIVMKIERLNLKTNTKALTNNISQIIQSKRVSSQKSSVLPTYRKTVRQVRRVSEVDMPKKSNCITALRNKRKTPGLFRISGWEITQQTQF